MGVCAVESMARLLISLYPSLTPLCTGAVGQSGVVGYLMVVVFPHVLLLQCPKGICMCQHFWCMRVCVTGPSPMLALRPRVSSSTVQSSGLLRELVQFCHFDRCDCRVCLCMWLWSVECNQAFVTVILTVWREPIHCLFRHCNKITVYFCKHGFLWPHTVPVLSGGTSHTHTASWTV